MLKLRASSLPLNFICPGSARAPQLVIRESGEAAELGTSVHEALAHMVDHSPCEDEQLSLIAVAHDVDIDDLTFLYRRGCQLLNQVKDTFPNPLTEVMVSVDLGLVSISGHLDLISVSGDVARGLDWKSGFKDHDYSEQMRAYAALVLLQHQQLREVTLTVAWLREGEIENYTMTRDGAELWAQRVIARIVSWDGAYNAGTHCAFCPRAHECPAANAIMRRDVAAILNVSLEDAPTELATMPPAELIELVRKASVVTKYAGSVRDIVRAYIKQHGDVVGPDMRLTIRAEERKTIEPLPAWPVLESLGFTDEDFAAVVKISKSKTEDRVKQKAGKGNGAAAVRDLTKALEEAEAFSTTTIEKMVERRN
jgi:hypothetical protein